MTQNENKNFQKTSGYCKSISKRGRYRERNLPSLKSRKPRKQNNLDHNLKELKEQGSKSFEQRKTIKQRGNKDQRKHIKGQMKTECHLLKYK